MFDYDAIMNALAGVLVWIIAWIVIMIIANWKLYTKAGEAGWKSLIPYYSQYVLFRITWNTGMFWAFFGASIASNVFGRLGLSAFALICSIATFIISLISVHKLSKAFGHGIGFTLGLIFLNPIFILILAFGSSEYEGPQ